MLTYLLYCVFHHSYSYFSCVFFSSTLIIALLGFEFARKAFHCTCACDIKTLSGNGGSPQPLKHSVARNTYIHHDES